MKTASAFDVHLRFERPRHRSAGGLGAALRALAVSGLAGLGGAALAQPQASSRCIDTADAAPLPPYVSAAVRRSGEVSRMTLQGLVQQATRRSNAIGAAQLLAEASTLEVDEARATAKPQASLTGGVQALSNSGDDIATSRGTQARVGVGVNGLLYDSGRTKALTGWRLSLAEAASQGQINAEEEVGLQTVSLALERGRQRLQAAVYRQYAAKMTCLVEALQQIAAADKGRASELIQARKSLQQVEISQAQTASSLRQVEAKLRRLTGAPLPDADLVDTALLDVPPLNELLSQAERSGAIVQLDRQAEAAENYSRYIEASHKPQVTWVVSAGKTGGVNSSTNYSVGVNVNVPLYSPGDGFGEDAAWRRVAAMRAQRADVLEARRQRVEDSHEQASAALDRARRTVDVIDSSERVRAATQQQWQLLGRRSLFDVMASESDYFGLRLAYVNAVVDAQQANALLRSLGAGMRSWLQ